MIRCHFQVKCMGCDSTVSYQDQILHHQLVRGQADPKVTEKVLARNDGGAPSLRDRDTVAYIETLEMAKRDLQTLSSSGGLHRQGGPRDP